ncbi:hypothetical protein KMW28_24710 [Flammeovirga yaeyamensis]|uniref:Uncharacterized protein n=1 Tax=Flammeovirga yaeyamensis TaxID=367791 RepID=A0AAX1N9C9_9BACT|nr:hypothetical protein [Flammeovirga yaeyamensis]MBB3699510.1 hypothetical protein [Flammeovirga yaeyamensis]NMF35234.1 hypothetical protein [Flammeovirga yaeyamensis]QWG04096.1 hypothetical protein KMW28_24710 [Flammeovirga yaeyamensis]
MNKAIKQSINKQEWLIMPLMFFLISVFIGLLSLIDKSSESILRFFSYFFIEMGILSKIILSIMMSYYYWLFDLWLLSRTNRKNNLIYLSKLSGMIIMFVIDFLLISISIAFPMISLLSESSLFLIISIVFFIILLTFLLPITIVLRSFKSAELKRQPSFSEMKTDFKSFIFLPLTIGTLRKRICN